MYVLSKSQLPTANRQLQNRGQDSRVKSEI